MSLDVLRFGTIAFTGRKLENLHGLYLLKRKNKKTQMFSEKEDYCTKLDILCVKCDLGKTEWK